MRVFSNHQKYATCLLHTMRTKLLQIALNFTTYYFPILIPLKIYAQNPLDMFHQGNKLL